MCWRQKHCSKQTLNSSILPTVYDTTVPSHKETKGVSKIRVVGLLLNNFLRHLTSESRRGGLWSAL